MHQREHLRRLGKVWVRNPLYFVTICTARRQRCLTQGAVAEVMVSAWRDALAIHRWAVGRYVIMPDHVHFFCRDYGSDKLLAGFVRDWKKWTARQVARQRAMEAPLWQPEFFDHLLRSARSYGEKWHYVRENPVRAGLVQSAEQWPLSGEIEPLAF